MVSQAAVRWPPSSSGVYDVAFDLSAKRELSNGFGNALSTAVELAVTPALLALIGWWIDGWLGTRPVFFLALFAFTIGYVSWKQYTAYRARMQEHERKLLGPRAPSREGGPT
jgi:F0F1-type ATP synthase assembly protein I